MWWEFALMYKVSQPRLKLAGSVHDSMTGKSFAAVRLEPAFADDMSDGTVSSSVVVKIFTHRPSQLVIAAVGQADTSMNGGRTKVNKQPVRP